MQQVEESATDYDRLASQYHLIYEDWSECVAGQARALRPILEDETENRCLRILDCTCGIGTQAIGLAQLGYDVVAADVSRPALERAAFEASLRNVSLTLRVADVCHLDSLPEAGFDAVLALENSLPHLITDERLIEGARSIMSKLRPGGVLLSSMGDYDQIVKKKAQPHPAAFYNDGRLRRIVHQVWDWLDERTFRLHLFITRQTEDGWDCAHYSVVYRALLRAELKTLLERAGFVNVRWLFPHESGFFQPLVIAVKPAGNAI